jgi:CheY-like chemotaxis protein
LLLKGIEALDEQIDDHLNKEGGIEVLKHIRDTRTKGSEGDKLRLPVIFWTARAAFELKTRCEEYVEERFLRWLEKPEDEEVVYETLGALLKEGEA